MCESAFRTAPSLLISIYGDHRDNAIISLRFYHKLVDLGHVKYVAFGTIVSVYGTQKYVGMQYLKSVFTL